MQRLGSRGVEVCVPFWSSWHTLFRKSAFSLENCQSLGFGLWGSTGSWVLFFIGRPRKIQQSGQDVSGSLGPEWAEGLSTGGPRPAPRLQRPGQQGAKGLGGRGGWGRGKGWYRRGWGLVRLVGSGSKVDDFWESRWQMLFADATTPARLIKWVIVLV